MGTNNTASGSFGSVAIGRNSQATGSGATSIGTSNVSSGTRSAIAGGHSNDATAQHSTVGGGEDNTATDTHTTVGGGFGNDATNDYSTISGGQNNTASGLRSFVGGGLGNTASSTLSVVAGGESNTAGGTLSTASGYQAGTSRWGQFAHSSGRFSSNGDAQFSRYILRTATTDATANVELFLDGTGGSNRITIPEETTFSFHIYITSIQQSGNNAKSSEIVGLIRRQNGGNATIVGQHTDGNKTFNDGGFNPSYTISADTTNQALKIDVTGIAATNIHTVATVNITEVKYA
jgi:hypothetical protein